MTRTGRSSRGQPLATLFAADALAAVLRVLQQADAGMTAGEIKKALQAGGVSKADADQAWPRLQKTIRWHDQVVFAESRYHFRAQPPVPAPEEALELLASGSLPAARRAGLVAIARTGFGRPAGDRAEAARRRQAEIDAVRAVAELAIEVEELTANQASARAMVHRVRARAKLSGLEPIDRAGDETTFDPKRHAPIGRTIVDGATVVVVRPGYVWKAPTEDVLISRAVVQDRS